MTREEVLSLVRAHLSEELEVEQGQIGEGTRFKEDLDADSLDLYELVMNSDEKLEPGAVFDRIVRSDYSKDYQQA